MFCFSFECRTLVLIVLVPGHCLLVTVMTLSFWTERSGQTVQTQIRLLLKEQSELLLEEQSDQGLHCLLFHLLHFEEIYTKVWSFSLNFR